ncbi:MAG: DUF262 domain-containing protein [Alphaproteobacteria bacterium]
MTKKISGAEYPLSKIFSSDFQFSIPAYQRPYAWGEEQSKALLADLLSFANEDNEDGYFLGSVVLIKSENDPISEVIDGQQRLTTLTILFAALADAMPNKAAGKVWDYILEEGDWTQEIDAKPRLSLRRRDAKFFRKYIQDGKISKLSTIDPEQVGNEAQKNIRGNALYFQKAIQEAFGTNEAALKKFIQFLTKRCFLVAVTTPNRESAYRVFSVMNSRGLQLQATDILKADYTGGMNDEDADELTGEWEQMEADLGREGFNELFSHIRMIHIKEKARKTLLEDFRLHVLPEYPEPEAFIRDVLEPHAQAFQAVQNANYQASSKAEIVNSSLTWLNRIEFSDWIPPALALLAKPDNSQDDVADFFIKLERLAAYMLACRINVNQRIDRFADIIEEIEDGAVTEDIEALELTPEEIKEFKASLNGEIYRLPARKRNYIILRLDSFLKDGGATYDPRVLTIEHVLPQTINEDSPWLEEWSDEEDRNKWLHRIANLVPLNRGRNSKASNFDFQTKCDAYFVGSQNVSSYALTTQVIKETSWSPSAVKKRQKKLIKVLSEGWNLNE